MEQKSISFRKEWKEAISDLPADERLAIYDAVFGYAFDGTIADLKGTTQIVFSFIKSDIDREAEEKRLKDEKSEKMRQLVMKRWHVETSVDTPVDTHVDTSVDTNVDTPVYTPVDTHVYTNVDTHVYTPVDTNVDTNVDTPVYTQKKPVSPRARVVGNQDNIEDSYIRDNNIQEEKESVGKKKTKAPPPLTPPPAKPPRGTPSATIEARKQAFYDSLVPYVGKYGKDTIRAFFNYWSECNKSRTKMRFELEKTWETPRRLATWASRDDKFKPKANGNNRTDNQEQARQRADDALAIMRQLRSEGEAAGQVGNDRGLRDGT